MSMRERVEESGAMLFPLFLKLSGRPILLVGGGPIATGKAQALSDAGAQVTIVSPTVTPALADLATARQWSVHTRAFDPSDLDGAWLTIAAAPPAVNREVLAAAEARRIFVVAVDDPQASSAYGAGIVRRAGVTLAVSTAGRAPALAGLLREGFESLLSDLLPDDLDAWVAEARRLRPAWRAEGVALADRRPRLLLALNELYGTAEAPRG